MAKQLPEDGGPGRPPVTSGPRDARAVRTRLVLTAEPMSVRAVAAAAGLSTGEASRNLGNLASVGRARRVPVTGAGHGQTHGWVAS